MSEGETVEEAIENMKKAMKGHLSVLEEDLAKKKDARIYEVAICWLSYLYARDRGLLRLLREKDGLLPDTWTLEVKIS